MQVRASSYTNLGGIKLRSTRCKKIAQEKVTQKARQTCQTSKFLVQLDLYKFLEGVSKLSEYTRCCVSPNGRAEKCRTWSEFFTSRVDADFGFSSDWQLLSDFMSRLLGDGERFNQGLIFDQRTFRWRQMVQQVVLQLLHLTLVCRHFCHQLRPLSFQVLSDYVAN